MDITLLYVDFLLTLVTIEPIFITLFICLFFTLMSHEMLLLFVELCV